MKFKKLFSLILIFAICLSLTGCEDNKSKFTRFEDFENATLGVIEGTVHSEYVLSRIDNVNIQYYNDHEVMIKDVRKGKIDGCVLDYPVAQYYEEQYSNLAKFPSPVKEEEFCLYASNSFNYYDEACDLINKWKKEGELESLQNKWFSAKDAFMKIDMNEYSNYNQLKGTLSVGFDRTSVPTSYYDKKGVLQGYEIELVYKLAKELNLKLKLTPTEDFDGLLNDLRSGKYDIAVGMIAVNDERKQGANFLPSTCEGGVYILTTKNRIPVAKKEKPQYVINSLEDLDGKKVGVLAGSMFESFLLSNNVLTVNKYYPSMEASVEAVANEEVVGAIVDKEIAKLTCSRNTSLTYINVGYSEYGAIFGKNNDVLLNQYNKFLQKVSMNGTLNKLSEKWSSDSTNDRIITDYKTLTNINGVVKLATSLTLEPYAYKLDNGQIGGFDVELVIEFCKDYGYALEIVDTSCDNIFNLVSSGACDMGAGAITKTLEREAMFSFSNATGKDGIALVILSKNSAYSTGSKTTFTLGEQFYNTFVANDGWLLLLEGLAITIIVSALSLVLGTMLGQIISRVYLTGKDKYRNMISLLRKIFRRTPIVAWLALITYIGFGGNYDTGIFIGTIVFTIWFAFEGFGLVEKLCLKYSEDDWANGYNLKFDKYMSFVTSVFYNSYEVVFEELRNSSVSLINNTTLLGLIYAYDFAYACDYIRMKSLVSWITILLMFIFYFSVNMLAEQLIDRIKTSRLKKKRSANDFNLGTLSKFSLEDDSDNLFRFKYQTDSNEYSRGLVGPIIRFENVKVDYDGRIGLNDVNVEINKGECVAFVGPAKSGITTFFNLINGFIEPTEGKVATFGKDTKIPELKKLVRNGVSIVLRNAFMIPNKNVIENIMIVLTENENMSKRKAYVAAYRLLFKIGLAGKAFCYEEELTLSEKKRLLLFRGLVSYPEIVVLDHIDEGLSKNELVELGSLLSQLKESGITLLIASDDFEWLQTLTNRMLVFDEGKIIDDDETEKLVNRPEKQKTIEFVSKSLLFHAKVNSKLFDHVHIRGQIWEFTKNNELPNDVVNKLIEIIELIEKEVIVKVMPSTFNLNMRMICEKALNQIKLNIEYDGNDFDYINSMAVDKYDIFARLVESIHYSYDGINKYDIIIPISK